MTFKQCVSCRTMKNIRGKKIICKRCEEELDKKCITQNTSSPSKVSNKLYISGVCNHCGIILKGTLRLHCACGHTFCSQECCSDFHKEVKSQ